MNNFNTMILEGEKISSICKSTFVQACHLCDREDCCDNTNPLVAKIKKLEAALQNKVDNADNKARQQAQSEICPVCNGKGWSPKNIVGVSAHRKPFNFDVKEYCTVCNGSGKLLPYDLLNRVLKWRGLDGDGITDPLRSEIISALPSDML